MRPPDRRRCRAVAAVFQAAKPPDREKPGSAMGGQGRQLHPMQGDVPSAGERLFGRFSSKRLSGLREDGSPRALGPAAPHPLFSIPKNMSVWPVGNPSSGF